MAQIRKYSMKEQIYQIIKKRILDLEYPMDTPLNLVQLSKELGISNTPLREALALLEAEGLVTSSLNMKMRVVNLTKESYRDLNRTILILLLGAYQLCIEDEKNDYLCQILEEKFRIQKELFGQEDTAGFISASIDFDKGFIIACQNQKLLEIFDNLSSLLYLAVQMNHRQGTRDLNIHEHEEILDAVKKNDCPLVQKLLRQHYDKRITKDY